MQMKNYHAVPAMLSQIRLFLRLQHAENAIADDKKRFIAVTSVPLATHFYGLKFEIQAIADEAAPK